MKETSASDLLMRHRNRFDGIKTGAPPLSRISMAITYLLAMRCPVYKQRDFHLGFDTELENRMGVVKVQAEESRGRKYRYADQGRTAS
jgi:hypothetical protein